ncbi:ATP-binding protein [Saccharibacillus sp. CPCC 101409]|uniref:ATP-binding protein n=1 Tax=Saccharibacillus sp. CPCC 101409 TaxID=3058041 RepID=UPI00267402DE|nr:ATP-binding protein [Saccharibacillus sp. CPCC 101409]MDO3412174.1 ATP-binding protein [Saccharibacillus sp. CPCC 101409]
MSYRKKQLLGFGIILFALMILLFILAAMLDGVRQNLAEITDERYDKVSRSASFRNNFSYLDSELGYLINENDPQKSINHVNQIRSRSQNAYSHLSYLQLHIGGDTSQKLLDSIQQGLDRYMSVVDEVNSALDRGDNDAASVLFVEEAQDIRTNLLRNLSEYTAMQEEKMERAREDADLLFNRMLTISAVSALAIILIGVACAVWVIRGTGSSLRRVTDVMDRFDPGAVEEMPRLDVQTNDEIGNIARGYNHMIDALEDHNRRVSEFNQKIEDNNWLQTQLSELALLYQQVTGQEALARTFLSVIAPAVRASSALFYIREKCDGEERFVRIAAYAGDGALNTKEAFRIGEGLIGQAALDGREILIDVPDDTHSEAQLRAGIGIYRPKQIWVLPVDAEDRVEAVVELSALQPFAPLHRQLLEQVRSTLGIALQSVTGRMEVDRLLKGAQTLTEELQTQQEELRSVNDRLKQQYSEAERSRRELMEAQHELELNAEELRRSSQYKSEFLANMSHELRTPLNSILILSQLIAENPEDAETEGRSYAEIIHRSGQDLLDIVNDVLDLSKVEAGMLEVSREAVSLHDFRELVHYGFDAIAKQKNLDFEVQVAENVPEFFYTDGKRLQQIVKNLLSNAFKFTQQGKITCSLKIVDAADIPCSIPGTASQGKAIAVTVRDTGIGIAENKREIIFEAFRQADGSTERMYGGTGLGLSICREFARLLGGCLTLESEEGTGSVFTLYLPPIAESDGLAEPENTELPESAVLEAGTPASDARQSGREMPADEKGSKFDVLRGRTVLIADDDQRSVYGLKHLLEKRGMLVLEAENGREAVEQVLGPEGESIDLVLMDIMMPVMNGYDAMSAIREEPSRHELPIIALTAGAMSEEREASLASGASDYLTKPADSEQLISLLRVWLEG